MKTVEVKTFGDDPKHPVRIEIVDGEVFVNARDVVALTGIVGPFVGNRLRKLLEEVGRCPQE